MWKSHMGRNVLIGLTWHVGYHLDHHCDQHALRRHTLFPASLWASQVLAQLNQAVPELRVISKMCVYLHKCP